MEPVLRKSEPYVDSRETEASAEKNLNSPLVDELQEKTHRLNAIADVVNDMLGRLEV